MPPPFPLARHDGRGICAQSAKSTGRLFLLVAGLLCGLGGAPAQGVLLGTGDGTQNTAAPSDDPGFDHVAVINGLSGVYLGKGWVLTAWHVGSGPVLLGGVSYPMVPGSHTRLSHSAGSPPDLALLKIAGDPGLPDLSISSARVSAGSEVLLIGHGKDRGEALSWSGHSGWSWATPFQIRWGTNRVNPGQSLVVLNTEAFSMEFDLSGPPDQTDNESQVTLGDSGGAVFWKNQGQWELTGILFAANFYPGQPDKTALEGNLSVAADLSHYRSEILTLTGVAACSNGLDDDLDGLVDNPNDPGCSAPTDSSERAPQLACDDGLDNDGDGYIDHPQDPDCITVGTASEFALVSAGSFWSTLTLASGLGAVGAGTLLRAGKAPALFFQSRRRTR
ncbi:S1 family peptidase [Myxococcota bacterium]|nr:S1 family peptidase [Myxococcota bacterium]